MEQAINDKSVDNNLLILLKFPDHWEVNIQGHGINLVGDNLEAMFKKHLEFLMVRFRAEMENVKTITANYTTD